MKKISVIIPCYNVEQYIRQCLESIINQTYANLEIICINDGSSDRTLSILQQIALTDNRIIVINQTNKGLSETRNIAVQRSTGLYIMFVDSDDYLALNTIDSLEQFFEKRDLICFSYNRVFLDSIITRKLNLSGEYNQENIQRRMVGLIDDELSDPSQIDSLVTACMKIYAAKIIKENNIKFTDTKVIGTEDLLFNLQYLEFVEKVEIIDFPFYFYRKTNTLSLTSLYKNNLFEKWKVLYEMIDEIIKDKPYVFETAFQNRICLSLIGLGLNETMSTNSYSKKIKQLQNILSDPLYLKAYSKLNLKFFPVHWKLFFFFAKRKNTHALLWMLQIIKIKISK